jgi:RHS repeat-associated protein
VAVSVPGASSSIVSVNLLDAQGRIVESRQPSVASVKGVVAGVVNPGVRYTEYYSAGSSNAACQNNTWIGLLCRTTDGALGANQSPIVTSYTYDSSLRQIQVVTTTGTATRTATTTYGTNALSQFPVTSTITEAGSTITTNFTYTTAGLQHTATSNGITYTVDYDDFGSVTATSDGYGETVNYTYTSSTGRLNQRVVANDASIIATDSFTYETERGLLTTKSTTFDGELNALADINDTVTYDFAGRPITETTSSDITDSVAYSYDLSGAVGEMTWTSMSALNTPFVSLRSSASFDALGRITGDWNSGWNVSRMFGFDGAGRLVRTSELSGSACVVRQNVFDVDSNLTSTSAGVGNSGSVGLCATTTPVTTSSTSSTFTTGSQLTSRTVDGVGVVSPQVFDVWGRTTALDASLTTEHVAVSSMTYRADGQLVSLSSGGVKDSWMFDANQARVCHREQPTSTLDTAPCGTPSQTAVTDTTDHGVVEGAVDYSITNTTTSHTLTWHHHSITHGTTAQLTTTYHTWWLSDLYGNLVTQHTMSGVQGAEPVIDENGTTTNTNTYTWAATHTKTRHHTGLITLTHRTYNPQTHQFLQPDPIFGGTPNPYTYPTDPINHQDYCGQKCGVRELQAISDMLTIGSLIPFVGAYFAGAALYVDTLIVLKSSKRNSTSNIASFAAGVAGDYLVERKLAAAFRVTSREAQALYKVNWNFSKLVGKAKSQGISKSTQISHAISECASAALHSKMPASLSKNWWQY